MKRYMKILFIFNPRAGKETVKNRLGDIIELFSMADNTITIAATRKRGDAARLVQVGGILVVSGER